MCPFLRDMDRIPTHPRKQLNQFFISPQIQSEVVLLIPRGSQLGSRGRRTEAELQTQGSLCPKREKKACDTKRRPLLGTSLFGKSDPTPENCRGYYTCPHTDHSPLHRQPSHVPKTTARRCHTIIHTDSL